MHDLSELKIKKNSSVIFDKEQQLEFKEMAENKIRSKLRANMSISNYGHGMTSTEKETMAISAEFAFCRLSGLPDPIHVINNKPFDFIFMNKTIDVKSTVSMNPRIAIAVGRLYKNYADFFVLIRQKTIYEFVFVGAITKEILIDEKNISQPPGWKNEVYMSNKLTDLEITTNEKRTTRF